LPSGCSLIGQLLQRHKQLFNRRLHGARPIVQPALQLPQQRTGERIGLQSGQQLLR
jgi:hypothetical protein